MIFVMTPEFPTGIVTLAFTDIEGSSDLWELHRAGFQSALDDHNRLIREVAARWNGVEVKTVGDSFMFVFNRPSDAVQWAVEAERGRSDRAIPACGRCEGATVRTEGYIFHLRFMARVSVHERLRRAIPAGQDEMKPNQTGFTGSHRMERMNHYRGILLILFILSSS